MKIGHRNAKENTQQENYTKSYSCDSELLTGCSYKQSNG